MGGKKVVNINGIEECLKIDLKFVTRYKDQQLNTYDLHGLYNKQINLQKRVQHLDGENGQREY